MSYDPLRVKEREKQDGSPVGRGLVLRKLIEENNLKSGAELGVRSGELYYYLLAHCPELELLGVDLYEAQPDGVGEGHRKKTLGKPSDGFSFDFESYHNFIKELQEEYGDRAKFIRNWTTEAVKEVEDESLDFVFIDADHAYKSVVKDIEDWSPKVKKGGFITGHDHYISGVKRAVKEKFGNDYTVSQDNVWIYKNV